MHTHTFYTCIHILSIHAYILSTHAYTHAYAHYACTHVTIQVFRHGQSFTATVSQHLHSYCYNSCFNLTCNTSLQRYSTRSRVVLSRVKQTQLYYVIKSARVYYIISRVYHVTHAAVAAQTYTRTLKSQAVYAQQLQARINSMAGILLILFLCARAYKYGGSEAVYGPFSEYFRVYSTESTCSELNDLIHNSFIL